MPIDARTFKPAKATDANTWCAFQTAYDAHIKGKVDGLGFVLGDGWIGIDLDDCRSDSGELNSFAKELVGRLDTYTEVSPSGTGVKSIALGELPEGHKTKTRGGEIEIYSRYRYFCITGHAMNDRDIEKRHKLISTLWSETIGKDQKQLTSARNDGEVHWPCYDSMLGIPPKDTEDDGSSRLFAWQCRAIEHNLSIASARATIREAAKTYPFPSELSDSDIDRRYVEAEARDDVVRGSHIVVRVDNDRLGDAIRQTIESLALSDIYQNSESLLMRYVPAPPKCRQALLDNGSPRLQVVPQGAMLEILSDAATFEYFKKDRWTKCRPDPELRTAVINRLDYPGVKPVNGVVSAPILLPSGSIVTTPGYNADSGLILDVCGEWPSRMENAEAAKKLRYVFSDFPFDGPSHLSACLAAQLTLTCRNAIKGNVPFFPFDGNRPGCGKGLATDVLTMIAEGRRASRYVYTGNQDELRKALTSIAIAGRNYILFDNIKNRFGGPVLEAAMTTGRISDRLLGASKNVELPLPITWLATVNSMTYERDMLRRSIPIMLNTIEETPHLREDFNEPNLLDYVEANRKELLIACLSIVANFIRDDRPGSVPALGGFTDWSDLIRGALIHAGFTDPCDHCQVLYEQLRDEVSSDAAKVIDAWTFPQPVSVSHALKMANEQPGDYQQLVELLKTNKSDATDAEYLGKVLRGAKGQLHNGRCLMNNSASRPAWRVEKVDVK